MRKVPILVAPQVITKLIDFDDAFYAMRDVTSTTRKRAGCQQKEAHAKKCYEKYIRELWRLHSSTKIRGSQQILLVTLIFGTEINAVCTAYHKTSEVALQPLLDCYLGANIGSTL